MFHQDFAPTGFDLETKLIGLSSYPRIADSIKLTWGSAECRSYLLRITENRIDKYNNFQQGFPMDAASVIFDLLGDHDDCFPQFIPAGSMWDAPSKYGHL